MNPEKIPAVIFLISLIVASIQSYRTRDSREPLFIRFLFAASLSLLGMIFIAAIFLSIKTLIA